MLGENLLRWGVKVYIDDMLIGTSTKEQHLEVLDQVRTKIESVGLREISVSSFFV